MSKRSRTTGVPRRRRRRGQAADAGEGVPAGAQSQDDASYQSRAEREAQLQRWTIRGVIGVAVVLAVLVAITFAVEQFFVPNQAVAVVNGQDISVREFRQEYQLERQRLLLQLNQLQNSGFDTQQLAQQEPYRTWINEINVPDQLGLRVINDMVDDRLLALDAAARGISVDAAAVQKAVERYFGFDPTQVALIGVEPTATPEPTTTPTPYVSPTPSPTPEPSPTPDPQAATATEDAPAEATVTPQPTVVEPTQSAQEVRENFEQNRDDYRGLFDRAGVAAETLDKFFERSALEALLSDALLPDDAGLLYADVRHILVEDEETALAALEALQSGESFAALARAISTDPGSGARGGELGDAYVGNYVPEFRQAIEDAEIGQLQGPVESEFGFHILQVRSKEERSGAEVEFMRERAKGQELGLLRESLRAQFEDSFEIFDIWLNYIPRN